MEIQSWRSKPMEQDYKFYIQRYISKDEIAHDIETEFSCKYVRLEGLSENGKVKNAYTESYAEAEDMRVFLPETPVYEPTDVSLTLLFIPSNGISALEWERKFFKFLTGKKFEYYDTFRKMYATMVMLDKPETVNEMLYGGDTYRQVKYTFKNLYGCAYNEAKILKTKKEG